MTEKRERETCELHGEPLLPGHVRIVYGYPGPGLLDRVNRERVRFPRANNVRLGGCCVTTQVLPDGRRVSADPRVDEVLYCPRCREEAARPGGGEEEQADRGRGGAAAK